MELANEDKLGGTSPSYGASTGLVASTAFLELIFASSTVLSACCSGWQWRFLIPRMVRAAARNLGKH